MGSSGSGKGRQANVLNRAKPEAYSGRSYAADDDDVDNVTPLFSEYDQRGSHGGSTGSDEVGFN